MSQHTAVVRWQRAGSSTGADYSRDHLWLFDGGETINASSAPAFRGDPTHVDPEEAFVASISSCHMLWFLHLASDDGWNVESYLDSPIGTMATESATDGSTTTWITDVVLRPRIEFAGKEPSAAELDDLHHRSHELCFIANSVRSRITVEGRADQ